MQFISASKAQSSLLALHIILDVPLPYSSPPGIMPS
jgi:hypothetical protein